MKIAHTPFAAGLFANPRNWKSSNKSHAPRDRVRRYHAPPCPKVTTRERDAFREADAEYKEIDRNTRALWASNVKRPHISGYDLWMGVQIWQMRRGVRKSLQPLDFVGWSLHIGSNDGPDIPRSCRPCWLDHALYIYDAAGPPEYRQLTTWSYDIDKTVAHLPKSIILRWQFDTVTQQFYQSREIGFHEAPQETFAIPDLASQVELEIRWNGMLSGKIRLTPGKPWHRRGGPFVWERWPPTDDWIIPTSTSE